MRSVRRSEVARLLAIAAAVDNRRLEGIAGEAALEAWWPVVGDLDYPAAVLAIHEHRRERPDVYLQPGHIRQTVLAAQERAVDSLEQERAALMAFVAYTGVAGEVAAAHWGDAGWREEQLDVARRSHYVAAIEETT